MERAGRLLSKMKSDTIRAEDLARKAWSRAVGAKVAARTRAVQLVRDRLVVEVEDEVWRKQLITLTDQIVKRLESFLGAGVVADLEFRIGVPRIKPQRETSLPLFDHLPASDEARRIEHPIFRRLYVASRRQRVAS